MSGIDRYRPPATAAPAREGYVAPVAAPAIQAASQPVPSGSAPTESLNDNSSANRGSRSPTSRCRGDVPPAAPPPPSRYSSRTSPQHPRSQRGVQSPGSGARSTPRPLPSSQSQQVKRLPSPPPRSNQWYFLPEEIASAPSVLDGITPAEERLRRVKGVNFVYQAGILLQLPTLTLWVAGVFFHRFYMRYSMVEDKGGIHHYNIAATALFLANKTEENCRKTRDVICSVVKVAQKNHKLMIDEQSKEYWRWRDSILAYEELMLEILAFDLMVDNPYARLYEDLESLGTLHRKRLRDCAWAFLNDAALTTLALQLEPRDLSLAAMFFATAVTHDHIDDVDGEAWWRRLGGNEDRMILAVDTLVEFYRENPLRNRDSRIPGSPVFRLENTRRPCSTPLGVGGASPTENSSGTPAGELGKAGRTAEPGSDGKTAAREGAPIESALQANGEGHTKTAKSAHEAAVNTTYQLHPGESDAGLQAVANDLAMHNDRQNGAASDALLSSSCMNKNGKRTETEMERSPEVESGDGKEDQDLPGRKKIRAIDGSAEEGYWAEIRDEGEVQ